MTASRTLGIHGSFSGGDAGPHGPAPLSPRITCSVASACSAPDKPAVGRPGHEKVPLRAGVAENLLHHRAFAAKPALTACKASVLSCTLRSEESEGSARVSQMELAIVRQERHGHVPIKVRHDHCKQLMTATILSFSAVRRGPASTRPSPATATSANPSGSSPTEISSAPLGFGVF